MTQEDKHLLLKDLCARLPYEVEIVCEASKISLTLSAHMLGEIIKDGNELQWKPYLRPMSSMTEEEKKEFQACHCVYELHPDFQPMMCNLANELNMFDWLNAHHFDVRNLIGRGLAIDCTDLNIY